MQALPNVSSETAKDRGGKGIMTQKAEKILQNYFFKKRKKMLRS